MKTKMKMEIERRKTEERERKRGRSWPGVDCSASSLHRDRAGKGRAEG